MVRHPQLPHPMNAYEYFKAIETDLVDDTGKLNSTWNELHICIASRATTTIPTLIADGTNVNEQDSKGRTPLHLAAAMNMPLICELLLGAGADPTIRDHDGHTADQRAEIACLWHVLDAFRPVLGREALTLIAGSIDNGKRVALRAV